MQRVGALFAGSHCQPLLGLGVTSRGDSGRQPVALLRVRLLDIWRRFSRRQSVGELGQRQFGCLMTLLGSLDRRDLTVSFCGGGAGSRTELTQLFSNAGQPSV